MRGHCNETNLSIISLWFPKQTPLLLPMPNRLPSLDSGIFPTRVWRWEAMKGLGIIVLGYMGLLFFGAIIVLGVGLAGHLLVQVPGSLLEWAHAPGCGVLAVC